MTFDTQLIQSSYSAIAPLAYELTTYFFDFWISKYPEARSLLGNIDAEKRKAACIKALSRIMDELDDLKSLEDYVESLGSKGFEIGMREEHYAMAGRCAVHALRRFLDKSWTQELEDQWISLIGFVADKMLEGSKKLPRKVSVASSLAPFKVENPDLLQVAREAAREILFSALEEELQGEFMNEVRRRATDLLMQAVRAETEQLNERFGKIKSAS